MLSAAHRLRHDTDIARVLKSKKGVFDAACGVKYARNNLPYSRFAVVVGTKVSKNAVDRNRVRRQYREIVRVHLSAFAPGYDVLFLTAKPALDLDYAKKESRLLRVLDKAGLLRADRPVSKDAIV